MRKKMRHVPNGKSWTEEAERAENAEGFPASIKGANAQIEEEKRVLINKQTHKQTTKPYSSPIAVKLRNASDPIKSSRR